MTNDLLSLPSDEPDNELSVTHSTHDELVMESTPISTLCDVGGLSEPIESESEPLENAQPALRSTPLPDNDIPIIAPQLVTDGHLAPNQGLRGVPSPEPEIDIVSMSSSTTELAEDEPSTNGVLRDAEIRTQDEEPVKLESRGVSPRPPSMGPIQSEQAAEISPDPSSSLTVSPLSPVATTSVLVSLPESEANMNRDSSLSPVLSSSSISELKPNGKVENESSVLPTSQHQRKRKRRTSNLENIDTTSRCDTADGTSASSTLEDNEIVDGSCSTAKQSRKRGRRPKSALSLSVLTIPSANGDHEIVPAYKGDPCEGVDMCALLIDALVFGRVAFQSAPGLMMCVLKDQPHLLQRQGGWKWLELARKTLTENACFARIRRSGKDADGNKLEDTWYYEPSMDPDRGRAETLAEIAPSTKRRKAKMGDRTYFYAPVDMNRWVVAAELGEEA